MAPPGRPNMTSTCCISRLLISACAPVSSIGCSLVSDGRWGGGTVGAAGFAPGGHRRADMKTTYHLGGRKAHTAKRRRVRYEMSTRVLRVRGVRRMVWTFLHGPGHSSSDRHPGVRTRPVQSAHLIGDDRAHLLRRLHPAPGAYHRGMTRLLDRPPPVTPR